MKSPLIFLSIFLTLAGCSASPPEPKNGFSADVKIGGTSLIIESSQHVKQLYDSGLCGSCPDPDGRKSLLSSVQFPNGEDASREFGLIESGRGRLTLAYKAAYSHWPKCFPGPYQQTASCVGHAGRICGVILVGNECAYPSVDDVTGDVEGWPEVSPEAEANGVICWENIYGDRGHIGYGASCSRLQKHVMEWGGLLLRQNYPELGIDLTGYQTRLSVNWGLNGTPSKVRSVGKQHQIRNATNCPNHTVCRDFLANGYPIWVCSSLAFSNVRDANGFSKQMGSWSHAWVVGAYDDRPETVAMYGHPLALALHDWGAWDSGGRRILGTNIDIPEGAWWFDATLLDQCECTAMGSVDGWPLRLIENYVGSIWGQR